MADSEVRRRLAAILAADVAGYSRLMGSDERATIATLREYRELFRAGIETHGGRVVDMAGDSVLAVFDSAAGAVQAAVETQGELAKRNVALPDDRRMQFRIGVNLGDIEEAADGTVYGDGVNIAARLEGLAEPGGVMVSESAHMQVRRLPGIAFVDAGEHAVKNIAEPVHAWHVAKDSAAPARNAPQLPDKPSIAVLAFDNLSRDPDQEYLADGIAEDLITALSHIHWLFVTARNSTFTYKGRAVDVKKVGRELGVRYVLEGSVRQAGKRIRVSAQLIDAATGNHLWAERYDRELEDIFALQDEITNTIACEIEPELGAAERARAVRRPPESMEAWGLYQRGLDHLYRFTAEDNAEAKRLFRAAADADTRFAAPLGALAYALFHDLVNAWGSSPEDARRDALAIGRKAVSRDDSDPMAHFGLGRALALNGFVPEAIEEFRNTIDRSPNFAAAYLGLSHALLLDRQAEEAAVLAETGIRLSPRDPVLWGYEYTLSMAVLALGDFSRAATVARRAASRPNATFWPTLTLISALAHLDRMDDARATTEALYARWPAFSTGQYRHALHRILASQSVWKEGLLKAGLNLSDITETPMLSGGIGARTGDPTDGDHP